MKTDFDELMESGYLTAGKLARILSRYKPSTPVYVSLDGPSVRLVDCSYYPSGIKGKPTILFHINEPDRPEPKMPDLNDVEATLRDFNRRNEGIIAALQKELALVTAKLNARTQKRIKRRISDMKRAAGVRRKQKHR